MRVSVRACVKKPLYLQTWSLFCGAWSKGMSALFFIIQKGMSVLCLSVSGVFVRKAWVHHVYLKGMSALFWLSKKACAYPKVLRLPTRYQMCRVFPKCMECIVIYPKESVCSLDLGVCVLCVCVCVCACVCFQHLCTSFLLFLSLSLCFATFALCLRWTREGVTLVCVCVCVCHACFV